MSDAYEHARSDAALFDLPGRGLVELAGKDAVAFLHNLCTNDVKNLPPGGGCEAFLCTAKARVVAHVFISRLGQAGRDVLWLDMVSGLADKVLRHLDHHLISEEVELTDRSAEYMQMHLCGPRAGEVVEKYLAGSPAPLKEFDCVPGGHDRAVSGYVRRHDYLALPGYDVFCASAGAAEARGLLTAAGAAPAGPEAYEVLRVEAGFPDYGKDIDEDRFVVEVGRTRQAISYAKGCYLGQEPVVMARDRGHVNRTLLGLKFREGGPVASGAKVFRGGEEVGRVMSSVWSPRLGAAVPGSWLPRRR
jgi:folate-binding protein YgfZ